MNEHEGSEFLRKEPCPECGSRDNLGRYTDGHGYCFGCGYHESGTGEVKAAPKSVQVPSLVPYKEGQVQGLTARGITEETCAKFGVRISEINGKRVHLYPYFRDNALIACKVRGKDKNFSVIGDGHKLPLFGQNLWNTGKKIIVTEGEIDCLTVSQLQGNKWPTISVPNGAQAARKALSHNLEFLEGFEEVILMFDMDEPGQNAAKECAELFSPGKCKIASLPLKDPNECLLAGRGQEVISAIWNAREYRPDGLVEIDDIIADIEKPIENGFPWCFETLTKATHGRRLGEVYGFGAGTGVGKTDILTQQIAYDITELGMKVGVVFLEQKPTETGKRIAGKVVGKLFHIPDSGWTSEELHEAAYKLRGKVTFYDSWGETEWSIVKAKIRYMAAHGVQLIYLDHLTAMADTGDEKGSLEQIMKEMAGLANELNIIIHFVSHLATPEGKPHEEGGRVMIRHFKGSRAIGFWSFFMFGLERNQQADDETERQTTTFRILKDRYTGQATGKTIQLHYDKITGRLSEQPTASEAYGF